jgi:hypothetical protein
MEKNESDGYEFVLAFKAWLRLEFFKFMGYLTFIG